VKRRWRASIALVLAAMPAVAAVVSSVGACSSSHGASTQGAGDAESQDGAPGTEDASTPADASADATDGHADEDAAPTVVGLTIASATGAPLQGAPGDAIPLVVLLSLSNGTTAPAPSGQVTWLVPVTVSAQDPYDAGASPLPEPGAQPTAFFVRNDYRVDNPAPGVLYVTDPGTVSNATITVKASFPDAGEASATIAILPALVGNAANGAALFLHGPECGICHGATGGGSPQAVFEDGGPELIDSGPAYSISGQLYPYPAPGLNDAPDSGNLATDPAWNAALLGMAAQSAMDNHGVALRPPMPDWFGGTNATGGTLSGQDFADIYAWLKTQTN
jgi:hypothetical protein